MFLFNTVILYHYTLYIIMIIQGKTFAAPAWFLDVVISTCLCNYGLFITVASLPPAHNTAKPESKAIVKFSKEWDIDAAYNNMTLGVETILAAGDFPQLRRACIHRIKSLKSNLPYKLIPQIKQTSSMNELLDVLAESEYWNWFDTRLLEALIYALGSPEAIEMLEQFKKTFYPRKISEFVPYQLVKPFKEFTNLKDKFDKDPSELTVYELLEHKFKLEKKVLDIDEGELVLSCIKTGCVELTWQVPLELVYRAYTSMKRKHDELSSLAVKSLVCEEANEYAGLPILWRGQEVGEVGPIEPLPEHIRQEPYSLPQGFHWVTLTNSDTEEVVKLARKFENLININFSDDVKYNFMHPNAKNEWQFSIQTSNGKLAAVTIGRSICISIGEVSITCIHPTMVYHPKYRSKRLWYMLVKELMRRANLSNINHLVFFLHSTNIMKPTNTRHIWSYSFNNPTSSQLPSSSRTPGWRRMTSEDVPIASALINKWSSQFEIRRVFNSEEEFTHKFLCPTIPNSVFTYVVENETNNITDLVSFRLQSKSLLHVLAAATTVVSTKSPVKELITDTLVCVKKTCAEVFGCYPEVLIIPQCNTDPDVLSSLSFQCTVKDNHTGYFIYNYRYHEVPETKCWLVEL